MYPVLSRSDLNSLIQFDSPLCITLYLNVHKVWPDTQENRIHFKHLLELAERRIPLWLTDLQQQEKVLKLLRRFFKDLDPMSLSNGTVVAFLSLDSYKVYELNFNFSTSIYFGQVFEISPILPYLEDEPLFFVLAVHQKKVSLLKCTVEDFFEVDVPDLPENLRDALWYEDSQQSLQFHTETQSIGRGRRPALFHGVESTGDYKKGQTERYLRAVERVITKLLLPIKAPLILAASEPILSIYRKICEYPYLTHESISIGPTSIRSHELVKRARSSLTSRRIHGKEVLDEFYSQRNSSRRSNDFVELLSAAELGRIEKVFLSEDAQIWGRIEQSKMYIDRENSGNNEDLANLLAVKTLRTGGQVYFVRRADMPSYQLTAALYRY